MELVTSCQLPTMSDSSRNPLAVEQIPPKRAQHPSDLCDLRFRHLCTVLIDVAEIECKEEVIVELARGPDSVGYEPSEISIRGSSRFLSQVRRD